MSIGLRRLVFRVFSWVGLPVRRTFWLQVRWGILWLLLGGLQGLG